MKWTSGSDAAGATDALKGTRIRRATPTLKGPKLAHKLDAGDRFPSMALTLTGGGTVRLPDDLSSDYNVILFYRGHW